MNLNRWFLLALSVYFSSLIFISYYSAQKHFLTIIIPSGFAFSAFILLYKLLNSDERLNQFLLIAFLAKVSLLFSFPHLSDDIYRFWWDGTLGNHGYSPYEFSPAEFIQKSHEPALDQSLHLYYDKLNSTPYHTVYPLICQWIFRICAHLAKDDIFIFNLLLKFVFIIADLFLLRFLLKLVNTPNHSAKSAALFFGNPLCIIELNANLHFELVLLVFLAASIYYINKEKSIQSGILLGCSIVSKLISLLWFPLFTKKPFLHFKQILLFIGTVIPIGLFVITVLPTIKSYQSSLELYFQKFEFNSFVFKPLLTLFDSLHWYSAESKISLILMLIFGIIYLVVIFNYWIHSNNLFPFGSAWCILFAYLLLNTTVHPWYLTPLIFLSVFYNQSTGIAWSFLILFSYARYDPDYIRFEPTLVLTEYVIVLGFYIYERRKLKTIIRTSESH